MVTGRYPSNTEVWDNASPLRSDFPTFAHTFRANDYRTILCGKMHFVGPDQHHGFQEKWVQEIYPADFRWTRCSRDYAYYNDGQNINRVFEAGTGWTDDMDYDEEVLFRAQYGLRRMKHHHMPFLLCVSFTGPHHPYCAPQEYYNMYSDNDVDLPEIPEEYWKYEHEYVKWVRHHGAFNQLVPDEIVRKARRAYMARVTMLDEYIGKLLKTLKDNGLDENTIVIYASDHGDMLGEHGLWFKNVSYEWSARVPLIFSGPGVHPRRSREPVSLMDFYSTLPGLAGLVPIYPHTDGRDVSDLVLGERGDDPGAYTIMENYGEGMWRGMRMIRRGNLKLNSVSGCRSELFDLERDPDEWHNLIGDPQYAEKARELEEIACRTWEPERLDELRWQSEERRKAIMDSLKGRSMGWQHPSTSPEHPLGFSGDYVGKSSLGYT
jgi:choline-sulfatase